MLPTGFCKMLDPMVCNRGLGPNVIGYGALDYSLFIIPTRKNKILFNFMNKSTNTLIHIILYVAYVMLFVIFNNLMTIDGLML